MRQLQRVACCGVLLAVHHKRVEAELALSTEDGCVAHEGAEAWQLPANRTMLAVMHQLIHRVRAWGSVQQLQCKMQQSLAVRLWCRSQHRFRPLLHQRIRISRLPAEVLAKNADESLDKAQMVQPCRASGLQILCSLCSGVCEALAQQHEFGRQCRARRSPSHGRRRIVPGTLALWLALTQGTRRLDHAYVMHLKRGAHELRRRVRCNAAKRVLDQLLHATEAVCTSAVLVVLCSWAGQVERGESCVDNAADDGRDIALGCPRLLAQQVAHRRQHRAVWCFLQLTRQEKCAELHECDSNSGTCLVVERAGVSPLQDLVNVMRRRVGRGRCKLLESLVTHVVDENDASGEVGAHTQLLQLHLGGAQVDILHTALGVADGVECVGVVETALRAREPSVDGLGRCAEAAQDCSLRQISGEGALRLLLLLLDIHLVRALCDQIQLQHVLQCWLHVPSCQYDVGRMPLIARIEHIARGERPRHQRLDDLRRHARKT